MKIAVLGCGNMGGAIIDGLRQKYSDKVEFLVWDTIAAKAELIKFAKTKDPIHWFCENEKEPDAVIIALKPQVLKESLSIFKFDEKKTLWISIAAGINLENLEIILPANAKIARAMPNTPALIGEGCCLYSLNSLCNACDKEKVEYIFNAVGISKEIPESQMNAATGLSGSGPAFIYTIIEALAEAGVAAGLKYEIALLAATQTVFGSAKMLLKTKETPASLKSKVMSPGGTTVAGNLALEKNGIRYAVMSAVIAAGKRAEELGKIT